MINLVDESLHTDIISDTKIAWNLKYRGLSSTNQKDAGMESFTIFKFQLGGYGKTHDFQLAKLCVRIRAI